MWPTAFVGVMPRCLESINVAALSKMIIRSGLSGMRFFLRLRFQLIIPHCVQGGARVIACPLFLVAADSAAFMIVPWLFT